MDFWSCQEVKTGKMHLFFSFVVHNGSQRLTGEENLNAPQPLPVKQEAFSQIHLTPPPAQRIIQPMGAYSSAG